MQNLKGWIFDRQFDEGIALKVEQDHKLLIYVLEDALFKIVFKKMTPLGSTEAGLSHQKTMSP